MTQTTKSKKPILITGCPRSGTTFCGRIVAKSPDVFEVYEPFNQNFHYNLDMPQQFYQLKDDADEVFKARFDNLFKLSSLGKRLGKLPVGSVEYLKFKQSGKAGNIDHVLALKKLAQEPGDFWSASRVSVKDPLAFFSAEWIYKNYDTDVVILVRHPGGIVSSFLKLDWEPETRYIVDNELPLSNGKYKAEIDRWRNNPDDKVGALILQWKLFTQGTLDYKKLHPDWTFVLHDELCIAPMQTFERIFADISLPMDEGVRASITEHTNGDNTVDPEKHDQHMLKRASAELMESWKKRLEPDVIERVLTETKDLWEEAQSTFSTFGDE